MGFGPDKITSENLRKMILAEIEQQLLRSDAFSNPSLAYYGADLSFTGKLKLFTRQMTERTIEAEKGIGTPQAFLDMVTVRGRRVAGTKLVVETGNHVRDRAGVPVR